MNQNQSINGMGYDPLAWMQSEENPTEPLESVHALEKSDTLEPALAVEAKQAAIETTQADKSESDETQIVLQPKQTLQNISELRQKLLFVAEKTAGPIAIDAAAVTAIDTATLQLILAFKLELDQNERQLEFAFPSEKFLEAAALIGLTELLQLNHQAAGLF